MLLAHLADGQLVVAGTTRPDPEESDDRARRPNPPISYEQARDELIRGAAAGDRRRPLDESLALWERGEQLAAICQSWLDGAKARIEAARAAATDPAPTDPPTAAESVSHAGGN